MDLRLERLLDLLDSVGDERSVGTSVRLPAQLREAAALAAEMGLASSVTELAADGLRNMLGAVVQRAVLDAHYEQHPGARPDLAAIATATAEIDGNPLARRPELIERAAVEVCAVTANPTPDDVLVYAAGLAAAVA